MKTRTTSNRVLNDVSQSLCAGGVFLLIAMALVASSRANTLVWTGGGGVNGNWNNSANWGSVGTPGNGDTVIFQGVAGLNSTNNIANLTLNQMRFISGGFNIYGTPFTLTNSLVATNFTGSINIYNTMTNGTANLFILTSNSITVTLFGNLNGPVGVVKAGLGTLTYNGPGDDSYTGTTLVSAGTLQLNVNGFNAFLGPLVIGDGSGNGAPTVRNLQGQEIPDNGQVTVNLNGLYDANNFGETIGSLTMQGSTVDSRAATLALNGNITVWGSGTLPDIRGNLSFNTQATIAVQSALFFPSIYINANLYDNGHGLVFTNLVANDYPNPALTGTNVITGALSIFNMQLDDISGKGLGATNPVTVTSAQVLIENANYSSTTKSLTLQGNNSFLDSFGNCTWAGPIVLAGNQGIYSYDNGPLNLSGPISGTGNLTLETFATNFVLVLSGSQANTFAGDFYMEVGTLELEKSVFDGAIPHNLILGWNDGGTFYSATNRNLLPNQINNSGTVSLNYGSIMDVNNYVETIGGLTLNNGSTLTGAGTLFLAPNGTVTVQNGTGNGINGNFNTGSGTLTMQGNGGITFWASVSGAANIVQNDIATVWYNNNSFSGTITVNGNGILDLHTSLALGNSTNTLTLNGSSEVGLQGSINLTNKTVTFNNTNTYIPYYGSLYVYDWPTGGTNSWHASFVLNATCVATAETNCVMNLVGPISGPGGVNKVHAGTFIYSGSTANTYTGLTTVNQGELDLAKSSGAAIAPFQAGIVIGDGTNPVTVLYRGGSQIFSIVTPVVVNNNALLNLNGFSDVVSPLTLNSGVVNTVGGQLGLVQVSSTGSSFIYGSVLPEPLTVTNSGFLYVYANILPYLTYGLTVTGPGTTTLFGANTFNGPTVVQQGYLLAANNSALGTTNFPVTVNNFATLELEGVNVTNKPLVLNGPGASSTYGALDVESGVNVWAGPVTNNGASTLDSWYSGSELHINGPISGPGSLELFAYPGGGGTHFFDGALSNSYAGLTTVDSGATLLLNKSVVNEALPGNLVINSAATVRLGSYRQMHQTTGVLIDGGGLLDMGANWDQIDTLQGSGTLNFGVNGYLEVGQNNGTSTFNGPMTGTGYTLGGYTFAKFGTGTFTMNGNSSFPNGAFRVWGGTFFENGLAPQVPVIVNAGATLGGTGTVNTITANGYIAPGNNGTGVLTCTSNLVFSSTGRYQADLSGPNPGSGYDQIVVAGTNGLANAGLTLNLELVSPVAVGQQFTIISNAGPLVINGTFAGVPEGTFFSLNGFNAKLSYVGGGAGKNVVLTLLSVPGSTVSSAVSSGDGSHGIDPNGCNNFNLVISNQSSSAMNSVSATLSTTTEGVVITQPYANYSNIPGNGTGTNITPFQISVLPSFVCGTPIALQLSVKSTLGAFTVSYTLNSGEVAATPSRYDISGNVAIPDVGAVDSTNVVSGFASTPIQKVAVSLWITHPFDSDLTNISLVSPDGTTVLLSSANGGSGANYGSGLSPDSLRTTFDDAAGTSITAGAAPFVGTFRPQSPLSAFAGNTIANGSWHLHIADGFGGSLGTLRGWSLFLYGTTCNSGSGPCDYCLTSISGTVTNTSLLQSNRISRNLVVGSCGTAKAWPGFGDFLSHHYDVYAFTNTTASDACVTAVLTSSGDLQAGIYLNAFSPTNIQPNYLADSGSSTINNTNNPQSCSATIPSGTVCYVTVNEITPNVGGAYTLQVSGLPCPPPVLNIQPIAGNKARLSWDTSGGGYVLESVSNLTANAWGGVTNEPIVSGGKYNVTNSTAMPATNRFYRLHMP